MSFIEGKIAEITVKIANLPTVIRGKADWLKAQFDAGPEQLRVAHNQLIDDLQDATAAGLLGATPPEGLPESTPQTVQGALDALRGFAGAHAARADNPHGVTAAQTGAYTKAETDAAIGQKVTEIGAGDMAKAVYDPTGRQEDIFAELDGLQDADADLSNRVTALELGGAGQNVAGYVGEITWFADNILRKNHVWADGAPIDPAQWPELAGYAAEAGWAQNEAGQYLTPDLRGRFLLGASAAHAAGSTGGREKVKLTMAEMPAHAHNTNIYAGNSGNTSGGFVDYIGTAMGSVYQAIPAGGGQPHENMPPYYTASAQIRAKVDTIHAHLDICPYEVGDILQTKNAAMPSERWPGTEWAAIETFLLGASAAHAAGSTGGSEKVALTAEQTAAHSHKYSSSGAAALLIGMEAGETTEGFAVGAMWETAQKGRAYTTAPAGGGQPHNNMPPYTAVYIWERTA